MQMKLAAVCCLVVVTFCLLDSALAHPPHRGGGRRGSEDSDVDHPRGPGFGGPRSEEDTTGEPEDVTGKPFPPWWRHRRHHRGPKPEDTTGEPEYVIVKPFPTGRPPLRVPHRPRDRLHFEDPRPPFGGGLRGEGPLDGLFPGGPHGDGPAIGRHF